ncbi:MAG: hypothetical protein WC899_04045 [bacterium]|jgi:hypothetical protein
MRKIGILGLVVVLALVLAGCGGGDSRDVVVRDIVSMGGADDGYIGLDSIGYYTVFSSDNPNTIVVSDDPADSRRGFVTFSLSSIPTGAAIRSATIFLPVLRATPVVGVPDVTVLVDMVSVPSLDRLISQGEMDSAYHAAVILQGPSISISSGDAGFDKTFGAKDAVNEALHRRDSVLQIRLIAVSGDVTLDDLLQSDGTGTPMLRVEYY